MPGLIRGVARTAAVVGTANAVSHRQNARYAAKDQQAAQAAAYQQQQVQQQYAAAAPAVRPAAAPAVRAPCPRGGGGPAGRQDQPAGRTARAGDPQRRGVRLGQGQGAGHLARQSTSHPTDGRRNRRMPGLLSDAIEGPAGLGVAERAGILAGSTAVGRSFSRGLMPRTTGDQAIITGAAAALNYGLTATSQSFIEGLATAVAKRVGDPGQQAAGPARGHPGRRCRGHGPRRGSAACARPSQGRADRSRLGSLGELAGGGRWPGRRDRRHRRHRSWRPWGRAATVDAQCPGGAAAGCRARGVAVPPPSLPHDPGRCHPRRRGCGAGRQPGRGGGQVRRDRGRRRRWAFWLRPPASGCSPRGSLRW